MLIIQLMDLKGRPPMATFMRFASYTFLFLLVLIPFKHKAQSNESALRLGATFGATAANFQGPGVPDQASLRSGMRGAIEARVPFKDGSFSINPGLGFIQKGTNVEDGKADYNVNLDYLEVPALAEVTFGDKVQFFSRMGPYLTFLQQARREGKIVKGTNPYTGEQTTERVDKDIGDALQNLHFGLKGGFGIRFPFFNGKLGFRLMVSRSLSEISKPSASSIFTGNQSREGEQYNRAASISAHYSLPLAEF